MSAPTSPPVPETMTVVNVRVPISVRLRLEAIAEKIAERDLSPANVSDVVRMTMGRGLPALEAELGLT